MINNWIIYNCSTERVERERLGLKEIVAENSVQLKKISQATFKKYYKLSRMNQIK